MDINIKTEFLDFHNEFVPETNDLSENNFVYPIKQEDGLDFEEFINIKNDNAYLNKTNSTHNVQADATSLEHNLQKEIFEDFDKQIKDITQLPSASKKTNIKSECEKEFLNFCQQTESRPQKRRKEKLNNSLVNFKNVVGLAKTFKNINCECTKKCFEKISEASRKQMFDSFWNINNFKKQNIFIAGLVQQLCPKRKLKYFKFDKSSINLYNLRIGSENITVCKNFFLQTFQISEGRLCNALKHERLSQQAPIDKRKCFNSSIKTRETTLKIVRDHISSFPSYQSHYTKIKYPNRKYLSSHLNVSLMYNLYKEHCISLQQDPVKENIYRRIFKNDFNLLFYLPRKKTCWKCEEFKVENLACDNESDKAQLRTEHDFHLSKALKARTCLKLDMQESQRDNLVYTFSFGLQKALCFPVLATTFAYYKRNMYVYNVGCHDLNTDDGFMYVWDETIASTGLQEIGSCIIKHIEMNASKKRHIVMYSDSCSEQSHNLKLILLLLQFLDKNSNNIEIIDHKFLVFGHSILPNDADFESIKLYAKDKIIHVPEDWYNIIANCGKYNSFHVVKMSQNDMKSTSILESNVNIESDVISCVKMKWIRLVKGEPNIVYYKESLNENVGFSILNLMPYGIERPISLGCLPEQALYNKPRPVNKQKFKDMQDLLPFIPPIYHDFYLNLQVENENSSHNVDCGPLTYFHTQYV